MSNWVRNDLTRAEMITALGTSGAISTFLNGVSASEPSRTVTVRTTDTGESFTFGMNVVIPVQSIGKGDLLMYDSTRGYFGISQSFADKNLSSTLQAFNYTAISSTIFASANVVGRCYRRRGYMIDVGSRTVPNLCWCGTKGDSSGSPYNYNIPADGSLNVGATAYAKGGTVGYSVWNADLIDTYYGSGASSRNTDWCPIAKDTWNNAVSAGTKTLLEPSNKYTSGGTITLADYSNDWYQYVHERLFPKIPSVGAYGQPDHSGKEITKTIVDFMAANEKEINGTPVTVDTVDTRVDYAAGYCYNYAHASAPHFAAHLWWLPKLAEMVAVAQCRKWQSNWGSYSWTSTQSSSPNAWLVNTNGLVPDSLKYYGSYVVPVSALDIRNL